MNRRRFLHAGMRAGALASLGMLGALQAGAAAASRPRALVCVFQYGGNDGLNTIVPRDAVRHARYAAVRGALAIPRGDLVALDDQYGLHPSLAPLQPLWRAGVLAPVLNVGPLAAPLTKADLASATLPDNLYSHSAQQDLWQCGGAQARTTGWGGHFATAGGSRVMAFGTGARFGIGDTGGPLTLPDPGGDFDLVGYFGPGPHAARRAAIDALLAQPPAHTLGAAVAATQRQALALGADLSPVLRQQPADGADDALDAAFGYLRGATASALAGRLYQVAKLLRHHLRTGSGTQVFFVAQGDYDTHANQADTHAALLADLGAALAAFHQATEALGMADDVTTFTMSDFGRTFQPNASLGTDHGWGNHHLVLGGAVRGGSAYGRYPELVLGGDDDAGLQPWEHQGRWIPGISVEQYAATLGRWLGLDDGALATALPGLAAFPLADLGFMRA